jgi:hypothetical protein
MARKRSIHARTDRQQGILRGVWGKEGPECLWTNQNSGYAFTHSRIHAYCKYMPSCIHASICRCADADAPTGKLFRFPASQHVSISASSYRRMEISLHPCIPASLHLLPSHSPGLFCTLPIPIACLHTGTHSRSYLYIKHRLALRLANWAISAWKGLHLGHI